MTINIISTDNFKCYTGYHFLISDTTQSFLEWFKHILNDHKTSEQFRAELLIIFSESPNCGSTKLIYTIVFVITIIVTVHLLKIMKGVKV
jgi:uncharacterized protein YbbK (DUF523 family)